jgi:hypothetical protein
MKRMPGPFSETVAHELAQRNKINALIVIRRLGDKYACSKVNQVKRLAHPLPR